MNVKDFKIGTFEELYPEFAKILDEEFIFLMTDECCEGEFDIDHLIDLTKEPSHKMPSGMTREERREWARSILEKDDENSK